MTKWNQAVTNRMRSTKKDVSCNIDSSKTIKCSSDHTYEYNYIFDNKLSPRCKSPDIAQNRSIYYSIRKTLRCKKMDKISKRDPNMGKKQYLKKKFDETIEKQLMQSKQLREMYTNTKRINEKDEYNNKKIILEKYSKRHQRNFPLNHMKKYFTANKMISDDDDDMNSIDNNIN